MGDLVGHYGRIGCGGEVPGGGTGKFPNVREFGPPPGLPYPLGQSAVRQDCPDTYFPHRELPFSANVPDSFQQFFRQPFCFLLRGGHPPINGLAQPADFTPGQLSPKDGKGGIERALVLEFSMV